MKRVESQLLWWWAGGGGWKYDQPQTLGKEYAFSGSGLTLFGGDLEMRLTNSILGDFEGLESLTGCQYASEGMLQTGI